jgi:hypothetical protein
LYWSAAFQPGSRQAGRKAGRKAGRQIVSRAGGRTEGRKDGRSMAGMQGCRRMYRKPNVQIYIHVHTYRNKDVQTYTDEQTDRQCRSAGRQADKHTDVQKDDCILKDRQTDRQTEQTSTEQTSTERQRDRQTDRRQYILYVLCKKIQIEI